MKPGTIVLVVLGVAGVAGVGYLILSKPAAPTRQLAPPQQVPAGYAQGGNGTVNTVSQVLGAAQQAENIFGQGVNIYNNVTG